MRGSMPDELSELLSALSGCSSVDNVSRARQRLFSLLAQLYRRGALVGEALEHCTYILLKTIM